MVPPAPRLSLSSAVSHLPRVDVYDHVPVIIVTQGADIGVDFTLSELHRAVKKALFPERVRKGANKLAVLGPLDASQSVLERPRYDLADIQSVVVGAVCYTARP